MFSPPTIPHGSSSQIAIPPPAIYACPVFTDSTNARWKSEVRFWTDGYPAGAASQFLSEIIAAIPLAEKSLEFHTWEARSLRRFRVHLGDNR